MLLVDQIGGSHMHGSTILYICYWQIRQEDHICMVLQFVHMLLVDQIGGLHMHGSTVLYICYWQIKQEDHKCMVIQVLVINVTGKLEEGIDLYDNMHFGFSYHHQIQQIDINQMVSKEGKLFLLLVTITKWSSLILDIYHILKILVQRVKQY